VSSPLPGVVHDLTAARIGGIIAELAASDPVVLSDKGYAGGGEHIRIPYKGKNKPASQQDANRAHARMRGPGERANAQLKSWPSCAGSAAARGRPVSSPRPSTSCKPARSEDEKIPQAGCSGCPG